MCSIGYMYGEQAHHSRRIILYLYREVCTMKRELSGVKINSSKYWVYCTSVGLIMLSHCYGAFNLPTVARSPYALSVQIITEPSLCCTRFQTMSESCSFSWFPPDTLRTIVGNMTYETFVGKHYFFPVLNSPFCMIVLPICNISHGVAV